MDDIHRLKETMLYETFVADAFLEKIQGVQALINRGATEGERDAARLAMERLVQRAKDETREWPSETRQNLAHRIALIMSGKPNKTASAPPPPRPKPPPPRPNLHPWNISKLARFTGGTSDKIYGVAFLSSMGKPIRIFTFWGGYGKHIALKEFTDSSEAFDVFRSKVRKGYQKVDQDDPAYRFLKDDLKLAFSKLNI